MAAERPESLSTRRSFALEQCMTVFRGESKADRLNATRLQLS